jgi:hypothetical protein
MLDWLPNLPVVWIALVVVAGIGLLTSAIYVIVLRLADGERAAAFAAVSPGMLPPMGILFALIVGFLAVGVWGNVDRAQEAVDNEASALRSVVILSDGLPQDSGDRLRALISRQIATAVHDDWPAMQEQRATLSATPVALAGALELALGLKPQDAGDTVIRSELVASIEDAFDARRQRIIVSESSINAVKWVGLLALAALTLIGIAIVHSGNRAAARISLAVFSIAVAVVVTMLVAQQQPFSGQLGIDPDVLEQVLPREG